MSSWEESLIKEINGLHRENDQMASAIRRIRDVFAASEEDVPSSQWLDKVAEAVDAACAAANIKGPILQEAK